MVYFNYAATHLDLGSAVGSIEHNVPHGDILQIYLTETADRSPVASAKVAILDQSVIGMCCDVVVACAEVAVVHEER